jgi:GTP-binding protein
LTRGDGKKYVMIDTAGIRRPGKVSEDLDRFAVIRSAGCLQTGGYCSLGH